MTRSFHWLAAAAVVGLCAAPAGAHDNGRGEAKVSSAGKTVSIDYGRPSLNGRDMLSRAEVGVAWRMGADAATTLTTDGELSFGGAAVAPGRYTLTATRTSADSWQLDIRGTDRKAVAEIPLERRTLDEPVEALTIELVAGDDGAVFRMSWGDTELSAPFSVR